MRLKVRDRRISEVETLFYRKGAGPEWSDAGIDATNSRGAADAAWLVPVPAAQRATREQLTGVALELAECPGALTIPRSPCRSAMIVSGLKTARGSAATRKVLIGDSHFNLAALGCRQQLQSGYFSSISRIHHRRVVAVDPDYGTVVLWANLDQAGTRALRLADGHTLASRALAQPASTEALVVLRIEGGDRCAASRC